MFGPKNNKSIWGIKIYLERFLQYSIHFYTISLKKLT